LYFESSDRRFANGRWLAAIAAVGQLETILCISGSTAVRSGAGNAKPRSALWFECLFEPVVRFPVGDRFPGLLKPSSSNLSVTVKLGHIRFDVEQRRSIKHVDIPDQKVTVLDPVELDCRQADGVWPPRSASGKKAAWLSIQEGNDFQVKALASMEDVDQYDM
jgi:hypothetical protein